MGSSFTTFSQQRLFAVQVFELHRLIKVQKLIAGSPHLLLEDTLKVYSAKKLSTKYVVNSPPQILRPKDDTQKPNREYATENAVVNLPLPSVSDHANTGRVDTLRSSYGPFSGNLPPAPVAADNKTGQGPSPGPGPGWGFQPPPGNQWLVPVMTPSEGLVYKPFAGPCPPTAGFMAPVYGGDFMNPSYMMPSHPHGPYFPPYGTQVMNPQVTSFSGSQNQLQGHVSQLSTGEVNMQKSRNSCNNSKQKSDTISGKVQTSKESELQGSTASSPFEKAQRGARALPLFPVNRPPESPSKDLQQQQARAIKVVPHNRRSATESAARIFRSIQEERQQHDSV
ncbi:hypothetical protein GIB67_010251 [Kingdonia uniflora]|uniref:Early flowering 3 n=1 Tax=Kingdonia uniflora TaxID=39325 RepID=A0A7J7NAL7_9MAGN|nr:hypothetical protein GIB67_010251 [Kingdonia uniflora]